MTIEQRNNGITDVTVLIADEGKVLRRIASDEIIGPEIWLGYTYYIGGVLQNPPHLDTQSDFDEIDVQEEIDPTDESDISAEEALNIITGNNE